LVVADELKGDAVESIEELRGTQVDKIIMLTGDKNDVAALIAQKLGVDEYKAELLPEDKVAAVEAYMAEDHSGKLAYAGDGINDAPVIARADVGIAVGAMGSDAAIETADVVLMSSSPKKVVDALEIARKTRRILWQNIIIALCVKGLFIALGAFGVASMWEAVFADVGVTVLAVFNATRILK
jgi:Cd2+/Zn2+-exporting ATPase